MTFVEFAVAVIVIAACIPDLRTRRIPNALTFGAAAAGIAFHAATAGWEGVGAALLGWFVGVAMFFPVFVLRGMGAGDLKLLGAVGAWVGAWTVLRVGVFSAVAGGAAGVLLALFSGYLGAAFRNLRFVLTSWYVGGIRPVHEVTLDGNRGPRLAYAIPIAIGTMVTLWLK